MFALFEKTAEKCSRITTNIYSTSFSLGIKMLAKDYRWAIYGIYGFVRLADEIVDSFERDDRAELLEKYRQDTFDAIEKGISLNPILQSFQRVAKEYKIGRELIDPFFESMAKDLKQHNYSDNQYQEYIYGSAEVVGLMCLRVFCNNNEDEINHLKNPARALGAAFQKVNFLRDMKSDLEERGRIYFPNLNLREFNEDIKMAIIQDVKQDFREAYSGIRQLPMSCRFGVYTAYIYYLKLLEKIERTHAHKILESRVRVGDTQKLALLAKSYFKFKLDTI